MLWLPASRYVSVPRNRLLRAWSPGRTPLRAVGGQMRCAVSVTCALAVILGAAACGAPEFVRRVAPPGMPRKWSGASTTFRSRRGLDFVTRLGHDLQARSLRIEVNSLGQDPDPLRTPDRRLAPGPSHGRRHRSGQQPVQADQRNCLRLHQLPSAPDPCSPLRRPT